jgi:hypothetical protein
VAADAQLQPRERFGDLAVALHAGHAADGEQHEAVLGDAVPPPERGIGLDVELGLAGPVGQDGEPVESVRAREIDVAVLLRVEDQVVPLAHHVRQHLEVLLVRRLVQAGEAAGDEHLAAAQVVQHRPQRVEGPLLRGLHHQRIAGEGAHELAVALDLPAHSAHEVADDVETDDLHAVERTEVPLGQPGGGHRHLVAALHHALGQLLHHFLHAPDTGRVELAGEQQAHRQAPRRNAASLRSTERARRPAAVVIGCAHSGCTTWRR